MFRRSAKPQEVNYGVALVLLSNDAAAGVEEVEHTDVFHSLGTSSKRATRGSLEPAK